MIKKATLFYSTEARELFNDDSGAGSRPGFCAVFKLYSEVISLSTNRCAYGLGRALPAGLFKIKILLGGDDWHIEFVDHYLKIATRIETTIEVFQANELVRITIKLFKRGRSNSFFDYYATFVITSGYLCGQSQYINSQYLKK